MGLETIALCLLIVLARIVDVSLGTLRTISVVNGRALMAWILGFFEILIWIVVVSQVIQNLSEPVYAVAYALGFATGNYAGIWVEQRIALGEQMVRIFTRKGSEIATSLRNDGYTLTEFKGEGRDGMVSMLFIETPRRRVRRLLERISRLDPYSFCIVDDVRLVHHRSGFRSTPTGWRAIAKKK